MIIPYPPSLNKYWRTFKGRVYLSSEAKKYKSDVRKIFEASNVDLLKEDKMVILHIDVYRPRKIGDLDNTLKGILDSLNGCLYVDDRQVVEIHARRFDDKENPRVNISWSVK